MASTATKTKVKNGDDRFRHFTDSTIPLIQIDAEKKAAKIILAARHRKATLLKTVQKEVEREIIELRAERNKMLQLHEIKVMTTWVDMEAGIHIDTDARLAELTAQVEKNQEAALDDLLTRVLDIHPQLHINLKL